ncbi:MAG: histidine kinase [Bacteroidota bacterium]|nr:histidine kinase [Bacteroidota bacterium]MDW8137824.1 histidine kinase [Bacteroidota bacterium]
MARATAAKLVLLLVPAWALVPLYQIGLDWARFRAFGEPHFPQTRGYDWVHWRDQGRGPEAGFVFPGGPADRAGIRAGDRLVRIQGRALFSLEAVDQAIRGIKPGSEVLYELLRGERLFSVTVRITEYPALLYPIDPVLWAAAGWGFGFGFLVHGVGLFILLPLAWRNRRHWIDVGLIALGALWFGGNTARILLLSLWGPLEGPTPALLPGLTFLAVLGWLAFPSLLLWRAARTVWPVPLPLSLWSFVPPSLYAGLLFSAAFFSGWPGGFTINTLTASLLLCVSAYMMGASGLLLMGPPLEPGPGWMSRMGTGLFLALCLLALMAVLGILPEVAYTTDRFTVGLVLLVQVLSLFPVLLLTYSTLKYGPVSVVMRRAVAGLGTLLVGLWGYSLLRGFWDPSGPLPVPARDWLAAAALATIAPIAYRVLERTLLADERAYWARLRRSGEALSRYGDLARMAEEAARTSAELFETPWAALALFPPERPAILQGWPSDPGPESFWRALYRTTPQDGLWMPSPVLPRSHLPGELERALEARHTGLLVPIGTENQTWGLLALGRRRRVFNLDDIERARAWAAYIAQAAERWAFLERERALVRRTAEAELAALRARINPHFLFNTLNTIAALIEDRPQEAEATVERLAHLFRHVLEHAGQALVPLETELELVTSYLDIERTRLGRRLRVEYDIATEALDWPVPTLAVQTLVENAVQHGVARQACGGTVRLRAWIDGEALWVEVSDTGPGISGFEPDRTDFFGTGLTNLAQRLAHLYGLAGLLEFDSHAEGTCARLRLPRPLEESGHGAESAARVDRGGRRAGPTSLASAAKPYAGRGARLRSGRRRGGTPPA